MYHLINLGFQLTQGKPGRLEHPFVFRRVAASCIGALPVKDKQISICCCKQTNKQTNKQQKQPPGSVVAAQSTAGANCCHQFHLSQLFGIIFTTFKKRWPREKLNSVILLLTHLDQLLVGEEGGGWGKVDDLDRRPKSSQLTIVWTELFVAVNKCTFGYWFIPMHNVYMRD